MKYEEILVNNFKECLKLAQRYILFGIGCGLFSVLTIIESEKAEPIKFWIFPEVNINYACFLAFVIYYASGFLALFNVERTRIISYALKKKNPMLLEAVMTYPSMVTLNFGFRILFTLMPIILMIMGSVRFINLSGIWDLVIFSVVISVPYLCLLLSFLTNNSIHVVCLSDDQEKEMDKLKK